MTTQYPPARAERSLQHEIMLRLNRYPVMAVPVPNGTFLPARTEAEARITARISHRMKSEGQLLPGAPDLVLLGERGGLCVELKRPASRDLLGRRPRGRLSPEQRAFRDRCVDVGVEYVVAECWDDIQHRLPELY